jgi:small-conductance mechanosensitive channel
MSTKTAAAIAKPPRIDPADVPAQFHSLVSTGTVWLRTHWMQALIAIAIGALIVVALIGARSLGARLARHSKSGKGWPAVFGRTIMKTGNFFIVTLAGKLVLGVAGAPYEVAATINFLFTVAATFQFAIWAREIILGAIEHRTRSEHYSGEAIGSAMGIIRLLVTIALFAIATIVVLDNLGVNVTGLVAGLGVGGIAIGLAAQGIFADLFAALAIIFDRPFRRGDAISYDQTSGSVEEIGLKSTRIRGVNGEERIISNKRLLDKEIQNNTKRARRRTKFALGLICQTPIDVCRKLPDMLREIVEDNEQVFVRAGFVNFGASSLDFELEFDTPSAEFQRGYDARHAVGLAILDRFNTDGIELAYPTQTSFSAAPDGHIVMPYAAVQPVHNVEPPEKADG